MKTVGQHMREARHEAMLTQKELADLSGIHDTNIARYETDKSTPSLYTMLSLVDALGISIDEYIGHTPRGRVKRYE